MRRIFKYRAPVAEKFVTDLPKDARLVRVEDVAGEFFIWAMVDPDERQREWRWFECYKTGQPIETDIDNLIQVGQFRMFVMQELMLYVFENEALSGTLVAPADPSAKELMGFQIFRQP